MCTGGVCHPGTARCLPPRPRGGAASSRFSQLLPTPPTAGRGQEGATLLRVERRGDGHLLGTVPVDGDRVWGVPDHATPEPSAGGLGRACDPTEPQLAHLIKELAPSQRVHSFLHAFIHSRNIY